MIDPLYNEGYGDLTAALSQPSPEAPPPPAAPIVAQGGLGGLLSRVGLTGLGQGLGSFGNSARSALAPSDPSLGVDQNFAKQQQRLALVRLAAGIASGKGLGQGLAQGLDASTNQYQSAMENAYHNAVQKKTLEQNQMLREHQLEQDKLAQQHWESSNKLAQDRLAFDMKKADEPQYTVKSQPLPDKSGMVQDWLIDLKDPEKQKPFGKPYLPTTSFNHTMGAANLTPEQNDALYGSNGAVTLGKLDPYKVNSKTASILANAYISNPNINMNALGATANLQRNSQFQQKAMTAETMPEVLTGVAEAGKKLNFSDAKFVGEADKWLKGQSNDPDLINYMTRRNDALFGIAAVMRGNGVTDKAYQAEEEAAHPTMSPRALEAWLSAQMASLAPRLKQYRKVTGNGESPSAPIPAPISGNGWSIKPVQ